MKKIYFSIGTLVLYGAPNKPFQISHNLLTSTLEHVVHKKATSSSLPTSTFPRKKLEKFSWVRRERGVVKL